MFNSQNIIFFKNLMIHTLRIKVLQILMNYNYKNYLHNFNYNNQKHIRLNLHQEKNY